MVNEIGLEWVGYTKVNSEVTRGRERVVTEFALSILINGKPLATAMMTPVMQKEFVVGHLFGQGIIDTASDIASLVIEANKAEVTISSKHGTARKSPEINSDFNVNRADIFEGVKAILKSDVFTETEAVHSAGLFKSGAEAVCIAEDIGRHNALDKVIGYGILNGVDFARSFVTSTGRMPSEMILRCSNANIPIIASKGTPTSMGIEIAEKAGLTIVGMVRGEGMIVYSNMERVK
jgi:FdhD protein